MDLAKWFQHLFLPHHSNNQKAKTLHLSSLAFWLVFISVFQVGISLLTQLMPGVLGFAANISPDRLIELTNQLRQEQSLNVLQLNPLLVEAARQKASLMFTHGCWSHNCNGLSPWSFFKNVGYKYLYAGENLAKDFGDSESVVNAWMASPAHRDNILSGKYNEVGIAVVNGTLNGQETTLIVQMFGKSASQPEVAFAEETKGIQAERQVPTSEAGESEINISQLRKIQSSAPVISSFTLTKAFNLLLVMLLIIILGLDSLLVYKNNIVRISGKSFVHASFFIIILISILLTSEGLIL